MSTIDRLVDRIQQGDAKAPPFGLRLWKLNERTGYWDYQRNVTTETADEWRRIFQIDEPTATFVVSKNKPMSPALRRSFRR
jgi:alpha-L-arabinofuranosidase